MKNIEEYKNFPDFNKKANEIIEFHNNIDDIRKTYCKEILHGYINLGCLSENAKILLNSNVYTVRLSLDTFIKNKLHHRDINLNEYELMPKMLKKPDKIAKSRNNEDIILFKNDNRKYMLVIKTTKNKTENYIKSFRRLSTEEYNKY